MSGRSLTLTALHQKLFEVTGRKAVVENRGIKMEEEEDEEESGTYWRRDDPRTVIGKIGVEIRNSNGEFGTLEKLFKLLERSGYLSIRDLCAAG